MIQEELQPLVVDDLTTPYYSKFYQKMTCKVRNPESWKKIADEYPGRTLDDLQDVFGNGVTYTSVIRTF